MKVELAFDDVLAVEYPYFDMDDIIDQCWQADDIELVDMGAGGNPHKRYKATWVGDGAEVLRGYCGEEEIKRELFRTALWRGWTQMDDPHSDTVEVDMGQFDPWDVSGCVQRAAWGQHLIG